MPRTREPPLSSGATSAIIKPTNLRWGLPPLPRFIDPTSTRPPLERGQEAVSSVSLSFPNLRFSIPPTVLPRIVPLVFVCFFRSLLLILRLVDGEKKRIRVPLFSKDRPCLRSLPLRVWQKTLLPWEMFHRIDLDRFFTNSVFNLLMYRECFI